MQTWPSPTLSYSPSQGNGGTIHAWYWYPGLDVGDYRQSWRSHGQYIVLCLVISSALLDQMGRFTRIVHWWCDSIHVVWVHDYYIPVTVATAAASEYLPVMPAGLWVTHASIYDNIVLLYWSVFDDSWSRLPIHDRDHYLFSTANLWHVDQNSWECIVEIRGLGD